MGLRCGVDVGRFFQRGVLLLVVAACGWAEATTVVQDGVTAVFCEQADPYYPLAEEVAAREGLQLHPSWSRALAAQTRFLIWVAAPERLSYARFNEVMIVSQSAPPYTAVGLITGSTLEGARALFYRDQHLSISTYGIINAANVSAGVVPAILRFDAKGACSRADLSKDSALEAITSDYVTVTCHGTPQALRLDAQSGITASDIPDMPSNVLDVFACSTACVWSPGSVALMCVDKGAAVYVGNVYNPYGSYHKGSYYALPCRYSFPGFPLGYVVLLRNLNNLKAEMRVPNVLLIGDPRTSLSPEAPYHVVSDMLKGEDRYIAYEAAPAGVIDVRIDGASEFEWVSVVGVCSTSTHDPFPNARIQSVDVGSDKLVSFLHEGGPFTICLSPRLPLWRRVISLLLDSLDFSLLVLRAPGQGASLFMGLLVCAGAVGAAWVTRAGSRRCQGLWISMTGGVCWAAMHCAYTLLRVERITITGKIMSIHWWTWGETFLLGTVAAYIFLRSSHWIARASSVVLPVALPLAAAVFYAILTEIGNNSAIRQVSTRIWDLDTIPWVILSLPVQVAFLLFLFGVLRFVDCKMAARGKS